MVFKGIRKLTCIFLPAWAGDGNTFKKLIPETVTDGKLSLFQYDFSPGNGFYCGDRNDKGSMDATKLIRWQDGFQVSQVHQGCISVCRRFDNSIVTAGFNKNDIAKHLERFREGSAEDNRFIALVFVDIIANIERIGDHAVNIADAVVDLKEKK